MKVFALPANEDWIVDQLVQDWRAYSGMACDDPHDADCLWLIADWCWDQIPVSLLKSKKVVTTVHHIVAAKFDDKARLDFNRRDEVTDLYHVYNQRTHDFIRPLTMKDIKLVPYWANQKRWRLSPTSKVDLRRKHGLPENARIFMSAQRDSEGHDLTKPKLEKGSDLLADALIVSHKADPNIHVLLGGWRRDYVINRLKATNVPFTYFERPPQETLCELYQCADLYLVTAREEGGPQSLLECGLLGVPMVSTPVGIAEQVLPLSAINLDVAFTTPAIPNVESMKLPHGMLPYRQMFENMFK